MSEKAASIVRDQRFYGFEATHLVDRLERTKHSLKHLVQGLGSGSVERMGLGIGEASRQGLGSQGQGLGPVYQAVTTTWRIDNCVYLVNVDVDSESVRGTSGRGDNIAGRGDNIASDGDGDGDGDGINACSDVKRVSSNHNPVHVCPAKAIDYTILRYKNHHSDNDNLNNTHR